jgi:hypothetical protein
MNMKRMKVALLLGAAALAALAGSARAVGNLADVEIYDRAEGRYLPVHYHDGRYYVVGRPGNEYQVSLRNNGGQRVLAVSSVDGVNVITGETATPAQTGYVIDGAGQMDIKGWRKNLSRTAAFYFTSLGDSYAARTGRPFDVGVIGVALFRERAPVYNYNYPAEPSDTYRDREMPAPQQGAAPGAAAPRSEAKSLGTGHGRSEWAPARYGTFERASSEPDEIVAIYYDSYANLLAQGVIPRGREVARPGPNPFPQRFAPDPRW